MGGESVRDWAVARECVKKERLTRRAGGTDAYAGACAYIVELKQLGRHARFE